LKTTKDNIVSGKPTYTKDSSVKPVQRRLLVPLAVVLLLLIFGFEAVLMTILKNHQKHDSQEKLAAVAYDLDSFLEKQTKILVVCGDVLLDNMSMAGALKTQDRDRLLADYEHLFTQLKSEHGITHFYFQRPDKG
jgi:hypothetical protein